MVYWWWGRILRLVKSTSCIPSKVRNPSTLLLRLLLLMGPDHMSSCTSLGAVDSSSLIADPINHHRARCAPTKNRTGTDRHPCRDCCCVQAIGKTWTGKPMRIELADETIRKFNRYTRVKLLNPDLSPLGFPKNKDSIQFNSIQFNPDQLSNDWLIDLLVNGFTESAFQVY